MSNFLGNNLLIVDGLNLCFRWKHERYTIDKALYNELSYEDALEFLREDLACEYFVEELKDTIHSIAASYKAIKIVLLADFGSSTWRKGAFPEYKGNREEARSKERPVDQAAFKVFFEHYSDAIKEIEEEEDITVIYKRGIEADDYAALICKSVDNTYDHIWLVSSDKDWDLLVSDKVSRFNWMTKGSWKNVRKDGPRPKEITLDNWGEHYGYPPEYHLGVKALQGDEGDNLAGIDGVGPVYAKRLLDKYKGIEGVLSSIPLVGTAAYVRNVNLNKELIERNVKLMDITSSIDEVFTAEEKERVLLSCLA